MSLLEPSITRQREILGYATDVVVSHAVEMEDHRVIPSLSAADIRDRLAQIDMDAPWEPEAAIDWCTGLLLEATVHSTSPRYFGLFNPTPSFMGIIGDVLAASYNPQLAVWSHAPGAVEMEAWLIRYFGERLGMGDNAQGSFTSGGAEANAMAIHLALTKAFPEFGSNGLRGVSGDPIVYISVESHHAWVKIAHACGIGRGSVRHIPVSDDLKMNVEVLKATIAEDHRNGKRPVLIAATAGTTSAGVIDLLPDVAKVAREADAFFHVDAAWGGSAILSDVLREHFVRNRPCRFGDDRCSQVAFRTDGGRDVHHTASGTSQ
jgi:glutamate/tyrosine decarboxylase-like PLP-dependent enzyme